MNKKTFLCALAVLISAVPASAFECGAASGFNYGDAFDLMDVNGDGFVSENEYAGFVEAAENAPMASDAQKQAKKKRLKDFFKQFDANKDNRLEKEEFIRLMTAETEFVIKEQAEQAKKFAENPELAMRQLQEAVDKLSKTVEKVNAMSTQEMAQNFIANISAGIADENFFQMDKNGDGCVTENEYAVYMAEYSKKIEEDPQFQMSEEDCREMYRNEKKAKPNCLTKDEYVRNFNETAAEPADFDAGDIDALSDKADGD